MFRVLPARRLLLELIARSAACSALQKNRFLASLEIKLFESALEFPSPGNMLDDTSAN
jgi:hypothetical protein